MGTALARSESETEIARKAASYRLRSDSVDGMDVLAVARAVDDAAERIRAGEGPQFLEMRTYRFRAHSMFDPELYRDKAEIESWKPRGPIATFTERLREADIIQAADLERIETEVAAEIAAAIESAEAAPVEPESDLLRGVHGTADEEPGRYLGAVTPGATSFRGALREAVRDR
jgi:TPP-dependent pyruvate/acetoin dehydrogenase alpha subunit